MERDNVAFEKCIVTLRHGVAVSARVVERRPSPSHLHAHAERALLAGDDRADISVSESTQRLAAQSSCRDTRTQQIGLDVQPAGGQSLRTGHREGIDRGSCSR